MRKFPNRAVQPQKMVGEARWTSGRDSGRRVVSLSKIHLPPKSTGNTQEAVAPSRHD